MKQAYCIKIIIFYIRLILSSYKVQVTLFGLLFFFYFTPTTSLAIDFIAVSSGNWNEAKTWGKAIPITGVMLPGVHYPGQDDVVTIPENVTITVLTDTKDAICKQLVLEPAKTILFNGAKIIINGTLQTEVITQMVIVEQLGNLLKNGEPSLTIGSAGHLKVSDTFNMGASTVGWLNYSFSPGSTVEFNGNKESQLITKGLGFANLILSGSGRKVVEGPINISEDIQIDENAVLEGGSYEHTVSGNWINNSEFKPETSTILLNSIYQKSIGGNKPTTFYNLVISGTNGAILKNDITVVQSLDLVSGIFCTGTTNCSLSDNKLIILGENAFLAKPETNSSYIKGRISSTRNVMSATVQSFGGIGVSVTQKDRESVPVKIERVTGYYLTNGVDNSIPYYINISQEQPAISGNSDLETEFHFLTMDFMNSVSLTDYSLVREYEPRKIVNISSTKVRNSPPVVKNTGNNEFGKYSLMRNMTPLPVELINFTLKSKPNKVLVAWETLSEVNTKGFEVQVSTDCKDFSKVTFIDSKSTISNKKLSYDYLHTEREYSGIMYFRLKTIDNDGSYAYSPVKAIKIISELNVSAYPNPFQDYINVDLSCNEPCQIILANQIGNIIYKSLTAESINRIFLNQELSAGIYYLNVKCGEKEIRRKLVKQ